MKPYPLIVTSLALAQGMVGCTHARPVAVVTVSPKDFSITRTYGWDTDVPDPQAAWSPDDYRLVARDPGGFVILSGNDGNNPPDVYRSTENRQSYSPAWMDNNHILFGPQKNVEKLTDGRVVPASQGLTEVAIGATPSQKQYSSIGFRPRIGPNAIYVQSADRILTIDAAGTAQEFGLGFYAEPQRTGEGIAWQETPIFETDWWTGKPIRSPLVVHWHHNAVDLISSAVQPHWTSDGGLAATMLHADPVPGVSWWKAGTDVVYIAGPGKPPVMILADARDPSPDPVQPLIAVSTLQGTVAVLTEDGKERFDIGPGANPQWSYDGSRLAVEDPPGETLKSTNHLTVYVLAIRHAAPAP
jgi:hypothetical protein